MIKAIMAADEDWGIGKAGTLPWSKNSEDLLHFKNKTLGHVVVMGSGTWNDPAFPKPLPGRSNVIITRSPGLAQSGISLFTAAPLFISGDILDVIKDIDKSIEQDVWIIGGASIFEQCLPIIEEFHVTRIKGTYNCDVLFKVPDWYKVVSQHVGSENSYFVYRKSP